MIPSAQDDEGHCGHANLRAVCKVDFGVGIYCDRQVVINFTYESSIFAKKLSLGNTADK